MSRPLLADPKRKSEADRWHKIVFGKWGNACWFCGSHATDSMHIIPRNLLGPLRYAIGWESGRPGCRRCHDRQGAGVLRFAVKDMRMAVRAHNKIARVKIEVP